MRPSCELELIEAVKLNPSDPALCAALVEELEQHGKVDEASKWKYISAALYPERVEESTFYGPSDYDPIIKSLGEVLIQVEQKDYQGSTWVLLKGGLNRYGFLTFGWGSCSGCDQLQACGTLEEIDGVVKDLDSSVKWFDTLEAVKEHIRGEVEVEGYRSDYAEWREFGQKVSDYKER